MRDRVDQVGQKERSKMSGQYSGQAISGAAKDQDDKDAANNCRIGFFNKVHNDKKGSNDMV